MIINNGTKYFLCKEHKASFEKFDLAREGMKAMGLEDMRVMEKMSKLNPELLECPVCKGEMRIHHWERISNVRTPILKCGNCKVML